jgi:hypothetical protein
MALVAIAVTGVLACAFLGGTTNAVNGAVCPEYFVTILGWRDVENVWRASIAQGIFEGLLFGLLFSLIFTVSVGIITGLSCTYGFAVRHLFGILGASYVTWALGGLAGMGLAALSPEFFRRAFIGVPREFGPMIRYAWVGGSIDGAELGGFAAIIVGLVILRANWRRSLNAVPVERLEPDRVERASSTDFKAS